MQRLQGRRASGRLQGSKRPRYAEPGISDDELDAAKDSDEAEEPVLKLPKASKQATPSGSKQQQRRQRRCVCFSLIKPECVAQLSIK